MERDGLLVVVLRTAGVDVRVGVAAGRTAGALCRAGALCCVVLGRGV
ncbi:MAG: hypothetical protein K2O46_08080 [Bacteroidales bacterium]|nr:hypothetical protein [Bacteroidales bacterium]